MPDNSKENRIATILQRAQGGPGDPHYLGYLECFNQHLYFEAHEVLEHLWLPQRQGPDGPFLKGLIQLAGAFVHLQKRRLLPAAALLRMAEKNLKSYAPVHHLLDVTAILALIQQWSGKIESEGTAPDTLSRSVMPQLKLIGP